MGDQNRCAAHVFVDGFANLRVGFHIHGGKRVIENFDRRVLHEHTGDGDALFLTAGDRHAALADLRIVAFGKAVDGVVDDGKAGILAHAFNIVAIGTIRNGVLEAFREQERFLQNNADIAAQVRKRDVADIHTADGDFTGALRQLV